MGRARLLAIGLVLAACASPANADDTAKGRDGRVLSDARKQQSLVHTMCFAGRGGMPLKDLFPEIPVDDLKYLPDVVKNVWEGCRQESVKDFSCYPYIVNKEDNSRTIFMPGNAPSNALYEPWTADCSGRVGRWPAWRGVKEDPTETEHMAVFYANNPPGELNAPSR